MRTFSQSIVDVVLLFGRAHKLFQDTLIDIPRNSFFLNNWAYVVEPQVDAGKE